MSEIKDQFDPTIEELKEVNGGSMYSGSTYSDFGITPYADQKGSNHPLIVTVGNRCNLSNCTCATCPNSFSNWWTFYCALRSEENDPCKR